MAFKREHPSANFPNRNASSCLAGFIHLSPTMQFSALLITLLASIILTAALPTGISFGKDLETAIAQKRNQGPELATSNPLSEEKRGYQLEFIEAAALNFKRDLKPTRLESRNTQSKQAEERPSAGGNRFDPNYNAGRIVENYEDALDASSPGFVGLGDVVETLDKRGEELDEQESLGQKYL